MFGALGEFAIGAVPAADAPLQQGNSAGLGALGEFALGEQGQQAGTGVTIAPDAVAIVFSTPAPSIRSGARINVPVSTIIVSSAVEINARKRRVKTQVIQS